MSLKSTVLAAGVFMAAFGAQTLPAMAEGDAAKGEKIFNRCKACHVLTPGGKKIGPSLYGVFGRTAGTLEGFKYSAAMSASNIVWSDETLSAYLENPRKYIPGNKMAFPGLRNPEQRADVIAYLHEAAGPAQGAEEGDPEGEN
ncbi:MAG: cytochrome c family protein [Pseudomonadota bacterium]